MSKKESYWFYISFILVVLLLAMATVTTTSGQGDANNLFLPIVSRARAEYWIESLKPAEYIKDIEPYQGGYLVSGRSDSSGTWLLHLEKNGQINWYKELLDAYLVDFQTDANGAITLAGSTFTFGAGDNDFVLMQLDVNGNILWQKTAGGSEWDVANALHRSGDGGFLVAGETYSFQSGSFDSDLWLVKFTDAGAISWQKTYGDDSTGEAGYGILSTSDGGYLITGRKGLAGWLLKIDAAGNVAWEKSVGQGGPSSRDHLVAAQQTADGGFLVAGQLKDMNFWTAVLIKFDAAGNLENSTFFGHPAQFFDLKATPDGDFIAVGESVGHAWLVKADANGQPLWQKAYGAGGESANRLAVAANGDVVVTGQLCTNQINDCAAWVLNLDSSGVIPNCSWLSSLIVSQVSWSISVEDTNVTVTPTDVAAADSGVAIQSGSLTETILCPDTARAACLEANK